MAKSSAASSHHMFQSSVVPGKRRLGSTLGAIASTASLLMVSLVAVQPADAVDFEDLNIFVSSSTSGSVDDIGFADEDILRYNTRTDSWGMFFDGSDVGIGASDIDGFHIAATEPTTVIHFSLDASRSVPGLGTVDESDTLTFTGTSGADTTGTLTRHIDGSDVGLTANAENIDALALAGSDVALSTTGSATVTDAATSPLSAADEDLISLSATSLGADTAGTFAMLFDGSDLGLVDRDMVAASISTTGQISAAFLNGFSVDGLGTDRDDIVRFTPADGSTGTDTAGRLELLFDGDRHRFGGEQIDGLHVQPGATQTPDFANLSISVNDDVADTVTPGTAVNYTVTVTNSGPDTAQNVSVAGALPIGLGLVSTTGCAEDPAGLPCSLGDIADGQAAQFNIVTSTGAMTLGTHALQLSVNSDTLDSDTADNTASVDTTFAAAVIEDPKVDEPVELTPTQIAPDTSGDKIFVSSSTSGTVDGISFADEDILVYNTESDTWGMFFDASDLGLGASDINGFHIVATEPNAIINLTLESNRTIAGLGTVSRSDVITFTGTAGADTAGTLAVLIDGSDIGLTSNAENIDALSKGETDYAISTLGTAIIGPLTSGDEDLLNIAVTSFGTTTAGTASLLFDGSDLGLADRDLVAASIDPDSREIYGTYLNGFGANGLNTDRDDIFRFVPADGSTGEDTAGTFSLYFDGDLHRFGNEQIDGLHVRLAPPVNIAPIAGPDSANADEGVVLSLDAAAGVLNNDVDPNGDSLTVSAFDAASALGAVVTVSADGAYSYDPTAVAAINALNDGQTIVDSFGYTVDDGKGGTTTATVTITVSGSTDNAAPSITSPDVAEVEEGTTAVIDVQSVDALDSEGAGLTYSISGGADQALFTIDTNTGALTFIAAPVFDHPTDAGADNVYEVIVTITDSGRLSAHQALTVTVTKTVVQDNRAPIALPDSASIAEDGLLNLNVTGPSGFGGFGHGLGQFAKPYAIAVAANGDIVTADTDNHRIQTCNPDGTTCTTFGTFGHHPGQFDYPYGIAIDKAGNIIIADTKNHRIQTCNPDGTTCTTFGTFGHHPGQFDYPYGIAIDKAGNIIIADTKNHRIQTCNPDGTTCTTFGTFGHHPGQFDYPYGIAIDKAGNIIIADTKNHRIQTCNPDGTTCTTFGTFGHHPGQFDYPYGIAIDKAGNIIIADTKNHRIQTCSTTAVCTVSGRFGHGSGQFDYPYGVAIDADGNVVVADTKNHRIQVLGPVSLLANDTDPDGDALLVSGFDAISALGATVNVNADGSYSYDPSTIEGVAELGECETRNDSFSYTVSDGNGGTATALVSVTIIGEGQARRHDLG